MSEANYDLSTIRHSAAHVMAAVIQKLYPDAKFDIPEEFDPCKSSADEMDEFGIDEVFE